VLLFLRPPCEETLLFLRSRSCFAAASVATTLLLLSEVLCAILLQNEIIPKKNHEIRFILSIH
jgi:hypothetical protein